MDLHVLRCSEHELTIFRKSLSVYLSVYLYACLKNFVDTRANARKVPKLNIQLHLNTNWCCLDIGRYLPICGTAMPHFPRIFQYLKYLISLSLLHGNKPDSDERILIRQKSFCKIFMNIELQGTLLLYIFLKFSGIFDFIYLWIFGIELNQIL